MKLSSLTWLICALGLAALLVFIGPNQLLKPPAGVKDEALIGGDFTLVDGTGKEVKPRDFKGKYLLVYFGYTHCPDICPTTLLIMRNALDKIGKKRDQVQPIFISVDPERDTPKVVGQYVTNFGTKLIGLTGTPEQVKQAADAYRVYYTKAPDANSAGGYLIDHSGFVFLMGPDGKYIAHFAHTIPESELVSKLNEFVK